MTIAYGLLYYIQKIVSPQFESVMIEKTKMVQEVDSIRCLGCLTPHLLCLIHNSSWGFVDSPAWAFATSGVNSILFQGFSRAADTDKSYSQ